MKTNTFFPEIIRKHGPADIPIDGVESYLIQAGQQQFIGMEFDRDIEVPEHSNAQWGVVLEGEMELTLAGRQPRILYKGDTYYIGKNEKHSAKIKKGYKDLTLFDQADRYKQKENDRNSPI